MGWLFAGIGWRLGRAVALFVLAAIVVAGSVTTVTYAHLTGTPQGAVGVLLVLGAVTTSVQAASSMRARRDEIALAQVRGQRGTGLYVRVLTEPIVTLLLGTIVGVVLGQLVVRACAHAWLQDVSPPALTLDKPAWITVAATLVVEIAAVVAGSWLTLRQPLVEQLDSSQRRRPATTLALFGSTAIIVAAAVSLYEAAQDASKTTGWVGALNPATLCPVLVGLAAGQVCVWVLWAIGTGAVRRGKGAGVASFLAMRRLARRADTTFGLRLVVAAAVVAGVAVNTAVAVAGWQDETTRVEVGGPIQLTVESGPFTAYFATQRIDPDGKWLMAATEAPDESEPYRRVFVDSSRWDAVVGDFYDGTAVAPVNGLASDLPGKTQVTTSSGDTASASFDAASLAGKGQVAVTFLYIDGSGGLQTVQLPAGVGQQDDGTVTVERHLPGCSSGCVLSTILIDGFRAGSDDRKVVISGLTFGSTDALAPGTWAYASGHINFGSAEQVGRQLEVLPSRFGETITMVPTAATKPMAGVITPGFEPNRANHQPVAYGTDGSERPMTVAGQASSLPFLGSVGMLLDLPTALAFSGPVISQSTSYILARADTPASVLDQLHQSGIVTGRQTFDDAQAKAQVSSVDQGFRLYTLVALFAGLIALVGLVAATGDQRADRRVEAASLRVVGVRTRSIDAAHRVEALWLAAVGFVLVAVSSYAASRVVTPHLDVVPVSDFSVPLQAQPDLFSQLVVAAVAALVIALGAVLTNRRIARRSPPSVLREELGR